MPEFIEKLMPLVSHAPKLSIWPKIKFWHDTRQITFAPDTTTVLQWNPPTGKVYIVIAETYGSARDFDTGNILNTTDFGFFHRHNPDLVYHWNPIVESLVNHVEPSFMVITHGVPLVFTFVNDTVYTVIFDFTVWLYEAESEHVDAVLDFLLARGT